MPYKNKAIGRKKKHEYYLKNKLYINTKNKLWYKNLPEKRKAQLRQRTRDSYKHRFTDNGISRYKVYMAIISRTKKEELKRRGRKYGKKYYQIHKEEIKKRHLKNYLKHRLYKWGLTPVEYNRLLLKQDNCCAICGCKNTSKIIKHPKVYPLLVDHNHRTNKVRGLLCGQCNTMLGMAKDNPKILNNAIAYLKRYLCLKK